MNQIMENSFIEKLTCALPRSPHQLNGLQESDAELIKLPGTYHILAVTTDSIVEEIESGLYRDPHLIGWMTVIVNASDLAAVGAQPLGILVNETLTTDLSQEFLEQLQKGIADACLACNMPVLGGDTNFSRRLQMGGCAIGLVDEDSPLTRVGCEEGDYLFASGLMGIGNAFALQQLKNQIPVNAFPYRPEPRLREGKSLRGLASACMDSSDGFISTIDQLARLNNLGFEIQVGIEEILHLQAGSICRQFGLPLWFALAGIHGEFELIFTIHPQQLDNFKIMCSKIGWTPAFLGRAVHEPGVRISSQNHFEILDTQKIRNLYAESKGNIDQYIKGLFSLKINWQ